MNQYEILEYSKTGFDNEKYLQLQSAEIADRRKKVGNRLYLEVGGKFLYDAHAARVLPGFDPKNKIQIFSKFKGEADLLFCVKAEDIKENRMLSNTTKGYTETTLEMIQKFDSEMQIKPKVIINLVDQSTEEAAKEYSEKASKLGYLVFQRYFIQGYPNSETILSPEGYGKDQYAQVENDLVIVTGAASNSGKMSTCLGQIYHESVNGIQSGYAKYETFPIWNLPLEHPVNLAYEAATADIGDYNVMDSYHSQAHGVNSVNYNRDVEAFKIVEEAASKIDGMLSYQSPTEMGINMAGMTIKDDELVSVASLREIDRRIGWYKQMMSNGGEKSWVEMCEKLKVKAMNYVQEKGYDINLSI